ncbi:MAG: tetratricopeptide repeat protein [Pirellulales bacterium]
MSSEASDVKSIFGRAVEIESLSERRAYIDRACGGDTALRAEVERLLAASEKADGFMGGPAVAAVHTVDYQRVTESAGTVIGPYKLMEQIGEGGFGLVFVAEQHHPVRRKVALKIIKPGMDTRDVIARFEAERQALALMDHPNIAKVFDAGATDSHRPYFVMELVRGIPITDYCDQKHLTPRDRLQLFVALCRAIQHAHQKGIIHRDVKPSNVLVTLHDGRPVVKVIDFGVAKALSQQLTERTVYTQFAQMIGTPLYMSPEQAEMSGLDIDTRSDIYSLGVLLYELLTGTTPFDRQRLAKAAADEVRRIIRDEEPPKPSTRISHSGEWLATIAADRGTEPARLSKVMRGELDWIVMKCLEKDRNRRYETANALARDIERYLADEAVEACPPSLGYKLQKMVRRNKGAAIAAGLILLCLVGGIVGTSLGLIAARRERDAAVFARREAVRAQQAEAEQREKAVDAQREEAEQRQLAELSEQKALAGAAAEKQAKETALAREAEVQAVLDFVDLRVFSAARPVDREGGLGWNVSLKQALETALPYVETSFKDQPLIEARLRTTLGKSFSYLGESKIAAEQYEFAHALRAKLLGPQHAETLESVSNLAGGYRTLGRHAEALKLDQQTFALRMTQLGPAHPDTLKSMKHIADGYDALGRFEQAIQQYERVLALMKSTLGSDHPDTLRCMNSLTDSYHIRGRLPEALKLGEETVALMKSKLGPDHPDTLRSMINLARTYDVLGRADDTLMLREAVYSSRKLKLGPNHPQTLSVMIVLARSYGIAGRHDDAAKLMNEISEHAAEYIERYPPVAEGLANWHGGEKNWRKSADQFNALLFEPSTWERNDNLISTQYLVASPVYVELGDLAGYKKLRDSAIAKFGKPVNGTIAERMLMTCLLLPAEEGQMATFGKWANLTTSGDQKWRYIGFNYTARALFEHRQGNEAVALEWGQKALASDPPLPCKARAHVLRALAFAGLRDRAAAEAELAQCRELINGKFAGQLGVGTIGENFWADWLIDRILLREADAALKALSTSD